MELNASLADGFLKAGAPGQSIAFQGDGAEQQNQDARRCHHLWNQRQRCSFQCGVSRWRHIMATIIEKDGGGSGGGGNTFLGFLLGAVLIVVAIVGFFMWDNYKSGGAPKAIVVTGQSK
jgi:hypothetical protein